MHVQIVLCDECQGKIWLIITPIYNTVTVVITVGAYLPVTFTGHQQLLKERIYPAEWKFLAGTNHHHS